MGIIRIIGGEWRGRRLQVPDSPGLRPTPDRVRETLFNWLAKVTPGARCLDAFAGSGALGFEARSRGAAYVEMVDQSANIVSALKKVDSKLGGDICIYQANVPEGLQKPTVPFDIVFLDPPYETSLLIKTCHFLETHQFLAKQAYIYLEARHLLEEKALPPNWQLIKAQKAGEVAYHLAKREMI